MFNKEYPYSYVGNFSCTYFFKSSIRVIYFIFRPFSTKSLSTIRSTTVLFLGIVIAIIKQYQCIDFIGESNIVPGIMLRDELVEIFGAKFACVDKGFGKNKPVDVVIRPEDIDLVEPEKGTLEGVVTHLIFKGVHYEMEVTTPDGFEWLVHSTDMFPVGKKVGIHVDPFDIQIMNKPASEDEEAVGVNE